VLVFEFHTRIDNIRVEPKDFDDYRKFREDVNRAYRVWLTLHASNDLDDAPLLEAVLALAPDDSSAAATLARLYQARRMNADARRVLARASSLPPRRCDAVGADHQVRRRPG